MENIVVAIITSIATLLVALIGLLGTRKLTKKPQKVDQAELISTLKDTLIAQTERIRLLEAAHVEQIAMLEIKEEEIMDLKRRVSNLEQLTIEQAFIIRQLQPKRRGRLPDPEGGEVNRNEDDRT